MADTPELHRRRRRPLLIRPTPDQVERVAQRLVREGAADAAGVIQIPVLVAALRQETGCSRATGWRSVADALAADVLRRGEPVR